MEGTYEERKEELSIPQETRKKSGSAKDEKGGDGSENIDPTSLVAADDTEEGVAGLLKQDEKTKGKKKKKGKGKKKRVPKSEKELLKLEKLTDKMKSNRTEYYQFLDRMDRWLLENAGLLIHFFRNFDEDGEGILSYDDFKSGMFDMNVPCNKLELHMLAKLLDRENSGDIEYEKFTSGLKYAREVDEIEREAEQGEETLVLTEREINHCKRCKMGIDGPQTLKNPKFLKIKLRMISCLHIKKHPGHFKTIVPAHVPVYTLHQIIIDKTALQSTKLSVFFDTTRSRDSMLPSDMTLQDLGYEGGPVDDPVSIKLFYDYKVEFTQCPLLLCDHYFGNNLKSEA